MTLHHDPSVHAGATVTVDMGYGSVSFRVEDWWDRVSGGSWMYADGNPVVVVYAMRSGVSRLPVDNEVLYGKDSHGIGHLIHVTEVQS